MWNRENAINIGLGGEKWNNQIENNDRRYQRILYTKRHKLSINMWKDTSCHESLEKWELKQCQPFILFPSEMQERERVRNRKARKQGRTSEF